jgi:hypothetical protein
MHTDLMTRGKKNTQIRLEYISVRTLETIEGIAYFYFTKYKVTCMGF